MDSNSCELSSSLPLVGVLLKVFRQVDSYTNLDLFLSCLSCLLLFIFFLLVFVVFWCCGIAKGFVTPVERSPVAIGPKTTWEALHQG